MSGRSIPIPKTEENRLPTVRDREAAPQNAADRPRLSYRPGHQYLGVPDGRLGDEGITDRTELFRCSSYSGRLVLDLCVNYLEAVG